VAKSAPDKQPQYVIRTSFFLRIRFSGPSTGFEFVLATNEELGNVTKRYEAATVIHSTIMSDGYGEHCEQL